MTQEQFLVFREARKGEKKNISVVVEGRQACPGTSTSLEHISAPFITLTVHSAVSVCACVTEMGGQALPSSLTSNYALTLQLFESSTSQTQCASAHKERGGDA